MYSPGHCVMVNETKKIISVKTLDKRGTEDKSVNLDKARFVWKIFRIRIKCQQLSLRHRV